MASYTFTLTSACDEIDVIHDLDSPSVQVGVFDAAGERWHGVSIQHPSRNRVRVRFTGDSRPTLPAYVLVLA